MTKKFKKIFIGIVASAMCVTGGLGAISVNAALDSSPNKFLLNYATGAPSSEIRTSQTNYASMGQYDPAITIQLTTCNTSSNTKYCRVTVPYRAYYEDTWVKFGYKGQKKDIALTSHGTQVYFTVEMVRSNTSQTYGNCTFAGTAN